MTTRLLSIHPDQATAARSASTCGTTGARVEFGVKGTRPDRPWAVVADRPIRDKPGSGG